MAKKEYSIMQNRKECYRTGYTGEYLHKHHIFGGARRSMSEKYGFVIWLRADFHNMEDYGIHFDKEFDRAVKAKCQEAFEADHTHEEWMGLVGRNYI